MTILPFRTLKPFQKVQCLAREVGRVPTLDLLGLQRQGGHGLWWWGAKSPSQDPFMQPVAGT